jgi:hypothetical protein
LKSALYTASLVLGILATTELFRRFHNRAGHRSTVVGAGLACAATGFATASIAFADPLVVRRFAQVTGVTGLATFISGTAVVGALVMILALLSWWIFRGAAFTVSLLAISVATTAVAGSMILLFAQSPKASKYTGTSLRFLVADTSQHGPLCNRPVAYACIYFSYVVLACLGVTLGFTFLGMGARGLGARVSAGFWSAAGAGAMGLLYGTLSLMAVVSGAAMHHLILPFGGTETATAFGVCAVLAFACAVLIPYVPAKPQRAR